MGRLADVQYELPTWYVCELMAALGVRPAAMARGNFETRAKFKTLAQMILAAKRAELRLAPDVRAGGTSFEQRVDWSLPCTLLDLPALTPRRCVDSSCHLRLVVEHVNAMVEEDRNWARQQVHGLDLSVLQALPGCDPEESVL